jgi:arylsulfatase A-like enzyme
MSQGFDYYYENLVNLIIEFNSFFVTRIYASLFPVEDVLEKRGLVGKRIAPQINRAALRWLHKECHPPFFLFLNYFDPHHPYQPLDDSHIRIPSGLSINNRTYIQWEWNLFRKILRKEHTLTANEKQYLLDRYDGEITQMDRSIGELFAFLKAKGMYDHSLIVVTSDHGESFGEHGFMSHPPAVYEELVKVPLIVKYPRTYHKTGRVFTRVSLIDIMPEVLTVVGIPIPQEVQGVAFSKRHQNIKVERYKDRSWAWTAYPFDKRSLRALYEGDYKYIWASNGNHELYNLREDPQELNNLSGQMPGKTSEMKKKLEPWAPTRDNDYSKDTPYKVIPAVEEALKALGYLQ